MSKPKYPFSGLVHSSPSSPLFEPTSFYPTILCLEWKTTMDEEFSALHRNCTWDLFPSLLNHKLVGTKWVYKLQRDAQGVVLRHKARLVAKDYLQTSGLDYGETFRPVTKPSTIQVVLTIALSRKWLVQKLDVSNAFLYDDLKKDIFIAQPQEYVDTRLPSHVCKLNKALYDLKQAPQVWYEKLKLALVSWGFVQSKANMSLFTLHSPKGTLFLLVYVDDIFLTGSCSTLDHSVYPSPSVPIFSQGPRLP